MQLEFVMLDPHVRTNMVSNADTGKFSATFVAPDNYGIFKFRVLYVFCYTPVLPSFFPCLFMMTLSLSYPSIAPCKHSLIRHDGV
jgi:hypothetical protein